MNFTLLDYLELSAYHTATVYDENTDLMWTWVFPNPEDDLDHAKVCHLIAAGIQVKTIYPKCICADISGWVRKHMNLLHDLGNLCHPMKNTDPYDMDSVKYGVRNVQDVIDGG